MPKLKDPTFYFVQDAMERQANIAIKLGDGRLSTSGLEASAAW